MKQRLTYTFKVGNYNVLVSKKIITPLNSKRIGRIYCEPIADEGVLLNPIYSYISLNVDDINILDSYPIAWIFPKYYSKKMDVLGGGSPILNKGFAIDVDEQAQGSEITISGYLLNITAIVVVIEYDDLPLKPFRTKYYTGRAGYSFGLYNALYSSVPIRNLNVERRTFIFDRPIVGVFGEIMIDNDDPMHQNNHRACDMYDASGKIGKEWDIYMYNYQNQLSLVSYSVNVDLNPLSNNMIPDEQKIRDFIGNNLITLSDGKRDLLKDVQLRVISVDNNISPQQAVFPIVSEEKAYTVTMKMPVFMIYNPMSFS